MTSMRTRFALGAILVALPACTMFDTDVKNPNAIEETALSDPASAPTQANGLNSAVTRMITSVYGPTSVASDEISWVGSREYWGKLDAGDVSDPRNEYADAAYAMAGEARWLSHYTISRLEGFDAGAVLTNRLDLVRSYVSGAIAWITIADNFDDFVIGSDRTVPTAPVGEANMAQAYDSAIAYLDKALPIAVTLANTEYQRQILGLRARAKFSRAVWNKLKPARTTPGSPLVDDAGANADATAALALMTTGYRYRVIATTGNTGTNNIASEMNSRQEIRAGEAYINPTANNLQPLAGTAGIKLNDPITGTFDPNINTAINECCRTTATVLIPFTQTGWEEMQLILAEAAIAGNGGVGTAQSRINLIRAADGVTAWDGVTPAPLAMLQHSRRVNLFLQGRRLADMYRFGLKDTRWLTGNIAFTKACFFPITAIERQANTLAPQPVDARPASCTP
jgi:hypothetical protein